MRGFKAGILGALVLLALLLGACGGGIHEGTVIGRSYDDPDDWLYLQPIPHTMCFPEGKVTSCTTTYTFIPIPMHDGPHWFLKLEKCTVGDGDTRDCEHGDIEVTEQTYNTVRDGDYYPTVPPSR